MVVFLGVVMVTCLFGVAIIPTFDRRAPLTRVQPVRTAASRSAAGRGA
jgi:hypothetical protein